MFPLNHALNGEPVRIMPGHTVVTKILVAGQLSAERVGQARQRELARAVRRQVGTPILPPIDEMFTMRPPPWRRMAGTAARVVCSGPQKWEAMASSKSRVLHMVEGSHLHDARRC